MHKKHLIFILVTAIAVVIYIFWSNVEVNINNMFFKNISEKEPKYIDIYFYENGEIDYISKYSFNSNNKELTKIYNYIKDIKIKKGHSYFYNTKKNINIDYIDNIEIALVFAFENSNGNIESVMINFLNGKEILVDYKRYYKLVEYTSINDLLDFD